MDSTIQQSKTNPLLLALLCAMLLIGIAYLHTHHVIRPVTIPQAVELRWAADTTWGNW